MIDKKSIDQAKGEIVAYIRRNWPWMFGAILTFAIGAMAWFSAILPACYETSQGVINCPTKWFYLKQSTPNELGDTLAGFAGALAFIWIIVTVAMQSMELSEQRKEFEKMAIAQAEQVRLLVKQGKIFEQEQRERDEERAKRELDQLLASIDYDLPSEDQFAIFESDDSNSNVFADLKQVDADSIDDRVTGFAYATNDLLRDIKKIYREKPNFLLSKGFGRRKAFEEILLSISAIQNLEDRLERAQLTRVRRLRLGYTHANIQVLLREDIWQQSANDDYKEPS